MTRSTCYKKVRYETEERARNVVTNLGHLWSKKSYAYKCPYGDHWHLTSKPQGAKRSSR